VRKQIRFAILSFAHYHANFWAQAVQSNNDAELIGIWDDDSQRGTQAGEQYRVPFYDDLDALLEECDAVGITSETANHVGLVEKAAAAGCHVLLEKPMAATLDECRRIRDAVKKSGVSFLQNFPKRFDPVNHTMLEILRRGNLGKISMARIRHGNFHLLETEYPGSDWFADPALSGGGALIDEGVHAADWFLWLFGMPRSVSASLTNQAFDLAVEDSALATLRWDSGLIGEIATGNLFLAAENSVELYGSKGSLLVRGIDLASKAFTEGPILRLYTDDMTRGQWKEIDAETRFGTPLFHQQGPHHFIECLKTGNAPAVDVHEGSQSLAIIEAGYRSDKSGKAEAVESL
jgi:predicted dehydrogenase